MPMWPDRRLLELFKIEHPIVLAPMAGAVDANLAIAVAEGGWARLIAGCDAQRAADAGAGGKNPRRDKQAD
jgi:NAD(P)H-dependent flavin oxidoreductase YrpB (nitropropane dioxygenase family)